ncbi:MAG: class I SAM-dependent methyltransferase [Gemmatimonadetes bacterium]|nr:class I SAM-dependent methyltransferase [Gemmatimonadota bacterium]
MPDNDSSGVGGGPGDPYSRVEYRRLIAWGDRIRREGPWLLALLDGAPERSVVDLGPGTGEHTAFFADQGARAVGVDASESMVEAAREHEAAGLGRFVLGDIRNADAVLVDEPPFGMAVCLGNVVPHLTGEDDLESLSRAVARILLPGGRFLIQLLNYDRILSQGIRHLPLNFRPGEAEEEIVFLRLMKPASDGRVLFFPTTLSLDPTSDEPVAVSGSKRVELRAWTAEDLTTSLEGAGFTVDLRGDMMGGAFHPESSNDVVVLATRKTSKGPA